MIQLDFNQYYILEDDFVRLRPLTIGDVEHLVSFSIDEPELWKFSLVQAGGGKEQMQSYIQKALVAKENKLEYPFIVFDKRNNQYAGSTRFYDIQTGNRSLQLGYTWYGKKFQGSGLNKHCKFLLLQFAFEKMGFLRVEFRADNRNERSIAAMKGIGCTVEGVLRQNSLKADGTFRDSIVLSILKDEWDTKVKEALIMKLTD